MNAWVKRNRKTLVAVGGVAIVAVGRHFGLDSEIYLDLVALGTVIGVNRIPNAAQEG